MNNAGPTKKPGVNSVVRKFKLLKKSYFNAFGFRNTCLASSSGNFSTLVPQQQATCISFHYIYHVYCI